MRRSHRRLRKEQFLAWQAKVIAAKRLKPEEQLSGMIKKTALEPPLRGSLNYMQFSPDGQYLLAQDESTVFVLSREPLANLFSFDAENAQAAQAVIGRREARYDALMDQTVQFTPDSRSVIFYDMELRVQKWDIATGQLTSIHQVTVPGICERTSLSSTGDVLACLKNDKGKDDYLLMLIDVPSNTVFFSKKVDPPYGADIYDLANSPLRAFLQYSHLLFTLGFSPDSRYFILGSNRTTVAYDLEARKEIGTNGTIRKYTASRFAFLTSSRIVGVNPEHSDKAAFVEFPSGTVQETFDLKVNGQQLINVYGSEGKLIPAARGPYLLVTPAARWPMAVINLETRSFLLGYKSPGLAIFGTVLAGEELGGRITLFKLSDHSRLSSVQLPSSLLPNLASSEFSSDGKWLAVAGGTSGGVWDAATGERAVDAGTFTGGFLTMISLWPFSTNLRSSQRLRALIQWARRRTIFTPSTCQILKRKTERCISTCGNPAICCLASSTGRRVKTALISMTLLQAQLAAGSRSFVFHANLPSKQRTSVQIR